MVNNELNKQQAARVLNQCFTVTPYIIKYIDVSKGFTIVFWICLK